MLPAKQDVAFAVVVLNCVRGAVLVRLVAVVVDCDVKVLREWVDGVVGALTLAVRLDIVSRYSY